MTKIDWRATSVGPTGAVYFDMFIDDAVVQDVWIAEFDMDGARWWSFRIKDGARWWSPEGQSHGEYWFAARGTLDEAKADAAMYFAQRELEKH